MKKRLRTNPGNLCILLRVSVLLLVVSANVSEHVTVQPASTGPSVADNREEVTLASPEQENTEQVLLDVSSSPTPSPKPTLTAGNVTGAFIPSKPDMIQSNAEMALGTQEVVAGSTTFIMTDEPPTGADFLDTTRWVWQFSWDWVTIVQLLISVIGVLGNLLVIVVMRVRKSATNSTDIFLGALAVADMLTSLFNIPLPEMVQVPANALGNLYCRIIRTNILSWICVISSSYILVGASFERLVAVIYPLRIKDIFTKRRVYAFIIIVWVFSFLSTSYYILSWFVLHVQSNIYCIPGTEIEYLVVKIVTLVNFVIRLVIPSVLMIVSQTAMVISLQIQSRRLQGAMSRKLKKSYHISARNRIIKTMLVVVMVYILCWLPSQIAPVITSFNVTTSAHLQTTVRQILNMITFVNSSINPFIYAANYPKFRSAIKDILVGKSKKNIPLFGEEFNQTDQTDP